MDGPSENVGGNPRTVPANGLNARLSDVTERIMVIGNGLGVTDELIRTSLDELMGPVPCSPGDVKTHVVNHEPESDGSALGDLELAVCRLAAIAERIAKKVARL